MRVTTEWLTPEQIAEELHVEVETVLRWLRSGQLTGYKVGRLWRVKRADLEAFIGRGKQHLSSVTP